MPLNMLNIAAGAALSLAVPGAALGAADWWAQGRQARAATPATVLIEPGRVSFPRAGEFLAAGRPVAAPIESAAFDEPLEIMAFQVTVGEYGRCVQAGACEPADAPAGAPPDTPVTGVSFLDAQNYAEWLSSVSHEAWRLPSDAEWAFAAAERFEGDPMASVSDDPSNPAVAWIRRYQAEAARKRAPDPEPKPLGFYGANRHGVSDMGGNVWEWTSTCYARATLAAVGRGIEREVVNCGVHVLEGRHRAIMSNFVRDGKSGGCAVGTPPDNLGFRLVREPPRFRLSRLGEALRAVFGMDA